MQVAVIDQNRRPLAPTSEVRARLLLKEGKAALFRRAKYRLGHLFEKPPDFDRQNLYSFTLRRGYQHRNCVYVIGTDAAMFESEMQKLAERLQIVIDER
jgi:RRXRR protein